MIYRILLIDALLAIGGNLGVPAVDIKDVPLPPTPAGEWNIAPIPAR